MQPAWHIQWKILHETEGKSYFNIRQILYNQFVVMYTVDVFQHVFFVLRNQVSPLILKAIENVSFEDVST